MRYNNFITLFLLLILFVTPLFAQKDTPFTAQQKIYTKGNSVLIGNTILGKHPVYAFDDVKILNDQVPLNFVDVDEDDTTFSSSAASFTLPTSAKKIKYAGLYWGGLYPAQSASRRKGKRKMKYTYLGDRNEHVQEIKYKINDGDYKEIIGQVIFDSKAKGPFGKESPYACFADVTTQVEMLKGEVLITVANVRATTGFIEGGAAAGWLLYLVYEDETETPKYFTSYSGFKEVSKEEVAVVFEELQPKNEHTSSSKILMAALEGDTRIKGDACAIYSDIKKQFIPLATEGRPAKNFFNSTVSVGHTVPTKRIPASKNTLGFDLIKMNVPDSTITSNTTDATIRLSTKQDRFYTFFLAFETEVSTEVLETQMKVIEEAQEITEVNTTPVIKTPATTIAGPPPIFTSPTPQVVAEVIVSQSLPKIEIPAVLNEAKAKTANSENEENLIAELNKIKNRASIPSKGMIAGYYLVTNVFANKDNATKWKARLNNEGYKARTFVNSKDQYIYVYIDSSKELDGLISRKGIVTQKPHLEKTWICRVNL